MSGAAGVARAATGPTRLAPLQLAALVATLLLTALLALPLLGLLTHVTPAALLARLGDASVRDALRLSLVTSGSATLIVALLGTPAAWLLATRSFRGRRVLEVLLDLPMVMPPTLAGFALLLAFGRMGLAGRPLAAAGITLPFSTAGVVLAQVFMSAPFFLASARAGFAGVDARLLDAAATLRAGETQRFLRVVLPLAAPSLLAGLAMSAARALGEFGASITFAGNLRGVTQTMPLAIYVAMESDLDAAIVLSVLLLLMSLALLLAMRAAARGAWPGWLRAGRPDPAPAR
ncbi:MAG TPA: ABC transporter permease [Candidatus Acidoferrales bacterium]|nr:ABC transporter permease [Candidatus Acidoferrales bacterium]